MLKLFANIGIRQKLYGGFGIVGILLIAIGVAAMASLLAAQNSFQSFKDNTEDVLLTTELDGAMAHALQRSYAFIQSRGEEQSAAVDNAIADMSRILETAGTQFESGELQAAITEMRSDFARYEDQFARVRELYIQRDDLVNNHVAPQGTAIRESISDYMEFINRRGEVQKIIAVSRAQQHFLLARIYLWRFLTDNHPEQIARVAQEIDTTQGLLTQLSRRADPRTERFVAEVSDATRMFGEAAARLGELSIERNAIRDVVLAEIGRSISQRSGLLTAEMTAEQDAMSDEKAADIASQQMFLGVTVVIATLFAVALAFLIARSLANPITRLTAIMGRFAGADYAETVPDTNRGDELGAMAKAVEVFKAKRGTAPDVGK